jgi:precorrin-6Y C5,15-methyltransferase (decarboxylating)
MSAPWLTILGIGEDGRAGLSPAALAALDAGQAVFGAPRQLALAGVGARGVAWPVPFDLAPLLARRGLPTVMLASGDPFWFGAGGSVARHLAPGDWICHPAPSTFALAAARLGWRLEEVAVHGLHAAPPARLIPDLHDGARLIVTLRDAPAAAGLAAFLVARGFGGSTLHLLERLGGPGERVRTLQACAPLPEDIAAPVALGIAARGRGLPRGFGLPNALFAHDGQISQAGVRALTLAALAPRPGERLWDLGAGSGSISVEWCLAGGLATAVEGRADRAANIRANAAAFGVDHRLEVVEGRLPATLPPGPAPDAIFVGGGFTAALWARLAPLAGARLVVNSVTLETAALVTRLQAERGGRLVQIALAEAGALGAFRGWEPARPVVQWSVGL